jgi:hypothetical protein
VANDRMTPVQAAKEVGIRPQQVYGFIKHHRVNTYSNPAGKTDLVSLSEVKAAAGQVKHHREKDPTTGKPLRRKPPVSRGTLVSAHGYMTGEPKGKRAHRVNVVTDVINDEDSGDPSLVAIRPNGEAATLYWEAEDLAARIGKGICHIESAESLLSVVMYHWVHNEQPELAASLQLWCESNDLQIPVIQEATTAA